MTPGEHYFLELFFIAVVVGAPFVWWATRNDS